VELRNEEEEEKSVSQKVPRFGNCVRTTNVEGG